MKKWWFKKAFDVMRLEGLLHGLQNRYSSVRIRLPPPSKNKRLVGYIDNLQAFFSGSGPGGWCEGVR